MGYGSTTGISYSESMYRRDVQPQVRKHLLQENSCTNCRGPCKRTGACHAQGSTKGKAKGSVFERSCKLVGSYRQGRRVWGSYTWISVGWSRIRPTLAVFCCTFACWPASSLYLSPRQSTAPSSNTQTRIFEPVKWHHVGARHRGR